MNPFPSKIPVTEELLQNINQPLPFSDEAEKGVISSLLQDPVARIGEIRLTLNPDAFYIESHRTMFVALIELYDLSAPIDPIVLTDHLRRAGLLDRAGGPAFITDVFTFIPSAAHFRHYLSIVLEKYAARRNITAHVRALHEFFKPTQSIAESISAAESHIIEAERGIIRRLDRVHIKEAIPGLLDELQERHKNSGKLPGWNTGFDSIDRKCNGLMPGKVTVFAGLPSDGKSTIMQNCARNALRAGARVGWYSLEMPTNEQVMRILCEDSGVEADALYKGLMSRSQQDMLQRSIRELSSMGADIVDTDGRTANEILADIESSRYDVAVVDYLQLMEMDGRRGATREEIIATISRRMKQTAKKTGCHILTASQLNDNGKLRESRAIGQDADNVFMVHKFTNEAGELDETRRVLFCDKNRAGSRHWSVNLLFSGPTFTFKEDMTDGL